PRAVDAGDTPAGLAASAGLSADTLPAATKCSQEAEPFTRLRVGQQVEFELDDEGQPVAMRSPVNSLETIRIGRDGDSYSFSKDVIEPEVAEKFASGTIDSSLFVAAQNA